MPKVKSHTPKLSKTFYPLVSVCTPTFNRRPFIPMMFSCFKNQTYPKDRMEWIIVDDGTDPIEDLVISSGIPQIKYFREEKKMALGEKRNFMHSKVKGTIIVYMDDDDYYPPERVSHAVESLTNNKEAMCAGASEIYVYFKHIQQMYQSGPYGPNHATAGTFAFRTELLKTHKYEDHAALAEEKAFLQNYTVPFVQLDPMKTILVFSHDHNTFDKKKLLENVNEQFFKPSSKTVDHFIRQPKEAPIKQFFMTDIDGFLSNYKPGDPSMKPDVLKQIKEIDEERKKMMASNQSLMINEAGKAPRQITPDEIVDMVNRQIEHIKMLTDKNRELEFMVANLQKKIANSNQSMHHISPPATPSVPLSSSSSFVDTLLNKIKDLESQLESNANIKRIEELELTNKMLTQQLQTKTTSTQPTGQNEIFLSTPSTAVLPSQSNIIKPKSKTMPEVKVVI
jgi:glycosyltransferase involved in cell wall biosynthesis